ncbi:unnamed protein product, partial [Heterotrigona itama]
RDLYVTGYDGDSTDARYKIAPTEENGLQAENGPQLTQAKIPVLSRRVEAKSAKVAEGSPTSAEVQ